MNLFKTGRVGTIVKINAGLLSGKIGMIAKEFKQGYGIIFQQIDWPTTVPHKFNALYHKFDSITDVTAEEQSMYLLKFPDPKQFE